MWQKLLLAFNYLSSNLSLPKRDLVDILFSLVLALIIGVIISQIYKYTHRGLSYELTFMSTLVFMAPVVSIVMMYIRGDLVLSLGLIGSLSIVRFRTAIKDTRDMIFLFWVIAVGLGCGTYNWVVVIISTIFIMIVMFALYFTKYGRSKNTDFVLVVTGSASAKSKAIEEVIQKYTQEARIRSKEVEEEFFEIIYELRFARLSTETLDTLIDDVKKQHGVDKVALLAPQLALPL